MGRGCVGCVGGSFRVEAQRVASQTLPRAAEGGRSALIYAAFWNPCAGIPPRLASQPLPRAAGHPLFALMY